MILVKTTSETLLYLFSSIDTNRNNVQNSKKNGVDEMRVAEMGITPWFKVNDCNKQRSTHIRGFPGSPLICVYAACLCPFYELAQ